MTGIGTSALRREDARLLLGRARFVDDVHLDGMLEGVFIRSTQPHAEIVSINPAPALAAGALAVFTAHDLPFNDRPWVTRYWHPNIRNGLPKFLATDRVRFVGDPIAFLVATDRYTAEDLAELVEVDYRPLPALGTMKQALAAGASQLHPEWLGNIAATFSQSHGNANKAIALSPHRACRKFSFVRQSPLPLENRGIVADYCHERCELTVWMSTQAHYNVRQNLATILDLPEYQVRVIADDVGGGFGSKSRTYPEELVVSHASRVLRRPVKWIEDRFENLQATTHSRGIDVELEIACDGDGRFTGLKGLVALDVGGYVFTSGVMTSEIASAHLPNAYKFPNIAVEVRCVGTNKTPTATYRGAGQPEAAFPIECLIDVLAKEVGISAIELRKRNLVNLSDMPYRIGTKVAGIDIRFESGNFPAMLESAIEESGFTEEVETTKTGERIAWGLAAAIEASGFVNFETANVRIDAGGNVTVLSGMTTQGQGQLTTFAQVCAEILGVRFECVNVRMGDTSLVPFGRGAFASRGAIFGANAVAGAAEKLKLLVLTHAATLLQCDISELTIQNGKIFRRGNALFGIGQIAQEVGPGGSLFTGDAALESQFVYNSDDPITYGLSVHAAKIQLEPRTGFFRLLDYLVVHDAGRSLNPVIVDGQIVGGTADGISGAIYSEIIYDENGQLLTGSLADYLVATAPEIPRIRLISTETRPGTNPLGVRGIGEGGTIPVSATIANALARAINPLGTGHESPLFQLPLKPERILMACRSAAKGG